MSHLGKASVKGPGAGAFINSCLTNNLGRITEGKAQYTLCCDEAGGVVDDLIVYLRAEGDIFLIPNASNAAEVVRAPEGLEIKNLHDGYGAIAVQGANSDEVLETLGLPTGHEYMSFVEADWNGRPVIVCRTGYTGERGYELVPALGRLAGTLGCAHRSRCPVRVTALRPGCPGHPAHRDGLPAARPRPELEHHAGAGAGRLGRRLEEGHVLGQGRTLAAEKAAGPKRFNRGLLVGGRGIPRSHCQVRGADGTPLGEVTSRTFSPTLKQGIALALLAPTAKEGDEVIIDVRGRDVAATVVKPPFVEVQVSRQSEVRAR